MAIAKNCFDCLQTTKYHLWTWSNANSDTENCLGGGYTTHDMHNQQITGAGHVCRPVEDINCSPTTEKPNLDKEYKNYHPVSNLTFVSKVLEKAMLLQYNNHVNSNHLIPSSQSAYRKHHSCETALVKLTNDILWNMENKNITCLCAIDRSAAFDTIDHNILLSVLKSRFGVEGTALEWFNNYLRPRSCKVNIGKAYSAQDRRMPGKDW